MKLSPICICPYGRLRHLQRTVEALKRNPEAAQSDLYLFSDAPREGDEERVAAVRRYLRTIRGFRSIEIIERSTNNRVGNWVDGEMSLLERFGRVISLEDDLVVAPGFLGFVNAGLEKYANDPRIFAICGYTPSMRLEWVTRQDACLAPRYSGWGYGYWKRSLEKVPRRIGDFEAIASDPEFGRRLHKLGDDFLPMLERELAHTLDAGDVRMNYVMARDDLRVVIPTISLVENIGFDDSGTHCPTTQRFSVDLSRAKQCPVVPEGLVDNELVIELLRRFRSRTAVSHPWQDKEILNAIEEITGHAPPLATAGWSNGQRQEDKTMTTQTPPPNLGNDIVFLLGLPRSGTTLLQRLLAEHAAICTTAEPWLLLPVCQLLKSNSGTAEYDAALAHQGVKEFLLELPGGEATFVAVLRNAVSELYGRCRGLHGARYFLDKTPRYHYIIPELAKLFPQAKFVVLLRNPLGVLASVTESWFGGRVGNALADEAHRRDLVDGPANMAGGLELLGKQACLVHYEALVTQPEDELRRICNYLEIDFHPGMLSYDPRQRFKGNFGDSIGVPQHDRADSGSLERWRDVLLRDENVLATRGYLESMSDAVLSRLGYEREQLLAEFRAALRERVQSGKCPSDLLEERDRREMAAAACNLGENLIEQNDPEGAAAALAEALRYVPDCAVALNDIGALWWVAGFHERAIEYFVRSNAADPSDRNTLINLTSALTAVGRSPEAQAAYLGYMALHPEDTDITVQYLSQDFGDHAPAPATVPSSVGRGAEGTSQRSKVGIDGFDEFTFSRRSHFAQLGLPPLHAGEDIDDCNLKVYQDMLVYSFIVDNFPPGARLLEVGGGNSRIIRWLRDRYEFWNLDKLEGVGNGLTSLEDTQGFRLVRDYIGAFNKELPDGYFDGVFSISTLEHVPYDDTTLAAITADIDRILKPGGLSLHCFDIVLKRSGAERHPLIDYFHEHVPATNHRIPTWMIRLDPDLWGMSRSAYERLWQPVTNQPYDVFGLPLSYNVLWRKKVSAANRREHDIAERGDTAPRKGPEAPTTNQPTAAADPAEATFCVLPWLHLQFNPEGSVKLCCRATGSLCDDSAVLTPYHQSMAEIWNSDALRRARRSLMNGEKIVACSMCYAEERYGHSYRTFSNQRWAQALGTTVADLRATIRANGVENGLDLTFLQLNLGNLCNLKCRMCSSTHSSQIERDPVHGRWSPHTSGNLAGVQLVSPDGMCHIGIRDQAELRFAGFHECEVHEGIPCRWTDGAGRIECHISFPAAPTQIVVRLLAYRPIASHGLSPIPLRVRINGCEVFAADVARGMAEIRLDVPVGTPQGHLVVEFDSPTYERNGRTAGIGLTGFDVVLAPSDREHGFDLLPLVSRLEPGRTWHESDKFMFGELLADTGKLRELYFTGGEPFINRQLRRILDLLVARGDHERIVLQFNSNLTSLEKGLLDTLATFKHISLAASVDAAGQYYEYIRHPARWPRVAANIGKIGRLPNVNLTFVPIISAYNVLNIVELCRYCDGIGAAFALHDLGGNDNIDLGVLPPTARRVAAERLRRYADAECRDGNRHSVLRIADRLDRESFEPDRLPEFMEFTNDLDASRHASFLDVHAELATMMAQDGYPWQLRKRYA